MQCGSVTGRCIFESTDETLEYHGNLRLGRFRQVYVSYWAYRDLDNFDENTFKIYMPIVWENLEPPQVTRVERWHVLYHLHLDAWLNGRNTSAFQRVNASLSHLLCSRLRIQDHSLVSGGVFAREQPTLQLDLGVTVEELFSACDDSAGASMLVL